MSSKVRMLWYNARLGKWYYGNGVWSRLYDEAARHMVSLPVLTAKKPKWQQVNWLFEHTKQPGSKMFIWREPRKMGTSRSPYVRMVRELGLTGKHYTVPEVLAWRTRVAERQRLRDREERARMRLELEQARVGGGRLRAAVPAAPRANFRVVDRFRLQQPEPVVQGAWGGVAGLVGQAPLAGQAQVRLNEAGGLEWLDGLVPVPPAEPGEGNF